MSAAPQPPIRSSIDPGVIATLDALFAASLNEVFAEFVDTLRESPGTEINHATERQHGGRS